MRINANRFVWTLLLGAVLSVLPVHAADEIAGTWEGAILVKRAEFEIDLTLHVAEEDGDVTGVLSVPTRQVERQPVESLEVDGAQVEFSFEDEDGLSEFSATLSGDEIKGTVTEGDQTIPFRLERVEERDRRQAERGEVEIETLGPGIESLREAFNEASDTVRMVMIQSPVCHICQIDILMVQRYLLDEIEDPSSLRVLVAWRPAFVGDDLVAAKKSVELIDYPNTAHFWSPEHAYVDEPFSESLDVTGQRFYATIAIYPAGVEWKGEAPPEPKVMRHHRVEGFPADKSLNAERLARSVNRILGNS